MNLWKQKSWFWAPTPKKCTSGKMWEKNTVVERDLRLAKTAKKNPNDLGFFRAKVHRRFGFFWVFFSKTLNPLFFLVFFQVFFQVFFWVFFVFFLKLEKLGVFWRFFCFFCFFFKKKTKNPKTQNLEREDEIGRIQMETQKWTTKWQILGGKRLFSDPFSELSFGFWVRSEDGTRLNSSHKPISYAVSCLKKKKTHNS